MRADLLRRVDRQLVRPGVLGQAPAPTIKAVSSIGGGGTSTLTIIALIIGVLGLLAGGFAIVSTTGSGEKQRTLA